MLFSTLFTTAALASVSFAAEHIVAVSDKTGALTFNPNNTKAAAGDTVTFHFWPQSHSVAQGTFAKPCEPKANGFWSGYVPVASGMGTTQFTVTVNDTKPIWFYCTRGTHCIKGMAGAINAPYVFHPAFPLSAKLTFYSDTGNTTDAYIAASKKATQNVAPEGVADGFAGVLSNMTMATGTGATASATGTGAAASATGTGAASALELSKGLGLAALLGFLAI